MTLWRIYRHRCQFSHSVEDAPWLEDRSCLNKHSHGLSPNPLCVIEFIVATGHQIDFKAIKRIATKCVSEIANKIIQQEIEDEEGNLIKPWSYDFGSTTTENLIDDLKKLMLIELAEYGPVRVQIWLDETRKYSAWDDGT